MEQSSPVVPLGKKKGIDEMCVFMLRKHLWNKALRHIKQQGHMALKAQTCCSRGDLEMLLAPPCILEAGTLACMNFKSNSGNTVVLSQETVVIERKIRKRGQSHQ